MNWFYIKGILILCGINLTAVLGLSLLTGFTGLFSFGHAGFMAVGGYAAVWAGLRMGLPFPVALLAGGLVAGIVSLPIGRLTLNLKGDYFCIATLGFGEAIRLVLDNVQTFGGARGWAGIPVTTTLFNVTLAAALGTFVMVRLVHSRHGRNMIAIREEELAARTVGINALKYKMMSLFISAVYAGVAGGLQAYYLGFLQPKMFSMTRSTELTIMVIFGGIGSISGTVLGSILLTALPELLRAFALWRLVVYGASVIFIMISRPEGLMGGKEISIAWFRRLLRPVGVGGAGGSGGAGGAGAGGRGVRQ